MGDVDVLIVGAGPTGQSLALELATQGTSFRIIDKASSRSDKSRALAVQPRTLELLNRHGAAQALASKGNSIRGNTIFSWRKKIGEILITPDMDFEDSEFHRPLFVSQAITERYLDELLNDAKVQIERPVSASDIVQDETGVTVKLSKPGHPDETVRVKYVVGCDGAHSVVRHASKKMTFEGDAYPQEFYLADVKLLDSCLPTDRMLPMFGYGVLTIFPLGDDYVRLVYSGDSSIGDREPTLEDFIPHLDNFAPKGWGRLADPIWLAKFRLHHRGVNQYRDGRLFVAGDAAHIHSPAGGQGMNTGIQDSVNLGWKLARVLRHGDSCSSLLDTYHAERWPVGQFLLHNTDKMYQFMAWTNPLWVWVRGWVMPWIVPWFASSAARKQMFFHRLSQFGVHYRASKIAGTARAFEQGAPVKGGDRLADGKLTRISAGEKPTATTALQQLCTGPTHHLVVFAGTESARTQTQLEAIANKEVLAKLPDDVVNDVRVHYVFYGPAATAAAATAAEESGYLDPDGSLHRRYGLTRGGYLWVRPDAYLGHIGPLEAIDELVSFVKAAVM